MAIGLFTSAIDGDMEPGQVFGIFASIKLVTKTAQMFNKEFPETKFYWG